MSNLSFDIGDMNYHNRLPIAERNNSNPNKNWIKKVCLIIIAAAVIAAAVWGITKIFDGGSYGDSESSDDVKRYEKAAEAFWEQNLYGTLYGKVNANKLKKQYPEFMEDTVEEMCSAFREYYESLDEESKEFLNYFKISFEAEDKEPIEKEELEEYQEDIRDFTNNDDEKINVQAGYQITVRMHMNLTKEGPAIIAEEEGLDEAEVMEVMKEVIEEIEKEFYGNVVVLKCNKKIGVWVIDGNYIWDM